MPDDQRGRRCLIVARIWTSVASRSTRTSKDAPRFLSFLAYIIPMQGNFRKIPFCSKQRRSSAFTRIDLVVALIHANALPRILHQRLGYGPFMPSTGTDKYDHPHLDFEGRVLFSNRGAA